MTISKNIKTLQRGLNIYTAGVALQEFFILCFIFLVVTFQRRFKREESDPLRIKQANRLVIVTYISLALISVSLPNSPTSRMHQLTYLAPYYLPPH